MKKNMQQLKREANWIRLKILDIAIKVGSGHIAPSFSSVEILCALYLGGFLTVNPKNPQWEERDRFILSKGHAGLVLYVTLARKGFFPLSELEKFTQKESRLGCHPENSVPGVESFTGSLGHGLSIGAGLALGAKLDDKDYLSVVLLGDGECHEGSIWEAAMFSASNKLNNLIAVIDHNGLSAMDHLDNYLSLKPFREKWESFGWETKEINGHELSEILTVLQRVRERKSQKPIAIIASTTKGKGISFMENNPIWHYRIPNPAQAKIAYKELQKKEAEK